MAYNQLQIRIFTSLFLIILLVPIVYFFNKFLAYLVTIIYIIIFYEIYKNFIFKSNKIYLILYLFFSFVFLELYIIYYFEAVFFTYCILIITSFDIFSFILGSKFGKKKIIPKISPNKTFIGYFFGLAISLIISLLFNVKYNILDNWYSIIFPFMLIQFSFFGDLLESLFKRLSNIKNSSNYLPGHGGFFDRFDSLISSAYLILPFVYLTT